MFGLNRFQLFCLAYITFGSAFYGYDSGITTSVLGYSSFLTYFNLNANTIGAFNSAYYAACAVGNIANWYLPDKFGRIRTLQFACLLNIPAIVLQTAAVNFGMFVAGRVIGGLACGIVFALCPVYASEIAPPHIRGRIGMIYAMNVSIGYAVTEWIGLGFYFIKGNTSWRVLFGLQAVPTLVMGIFSFWMPRSPRWLVMKGHYDEAKSVLKLIHGGLHHDDTFYEREFHQIKAQIQLDQDEQLGLKDIFLKPSYRKRVLLVMNFFLFQQLTGIIPLQNYQVFIYQICGFDAVMSLVLVGIWGTVVIIAVACMSPWFDRIGRRSSVFLAYSFIIPGALLIVIMWARFEAGGSKDLGVAKGIIFGMFFLVWGYGGILNTFAPINQYSSEIMPTCIRAAGVACGYATFNCIVILLVQVTPLALEHISWKYFLIFVICDFIFIVNFYFFYPETKNKTLEEIEAIFGDRIAETFEEAGQRFQEEKEKTHVVEHKEV
ncbi:hypothetical protein AYO22_03567 [Fonsecaea multimorphosa]|nr:hypothetical protein AYO22_03567 [Fonsecaea multimorphosa]